MPPPPAESRALPMRYLGEPITPAEALAAARRHARLQGARSSGGIPDELPDSDVRTVLVAQQLPVRALAFARARAEMEGLTITDIVRDALVAYGQGRPGSVTTFQAHHPD
jgi:hypothetical protein